MKFTRVVFALLMYAVSINAQIFSVQGELKDARENSKLSFGNIRVEGTSTGTAANIEGQYELRLNSGEYKLIASFIGYKSDTIKISLMNNMVVDFSLEPVSIKLDEITVVPGINPADRIIKEAIKAKQIRKQLLNDYSFKAYTKGLIKTTQDISATDNSVGVSIGGIDTAQLKITGILENESRSFFKKPDKYKEKIIARKQTSNFPSTINMLTGGRIIQDFYNDDIQFFAREIVSPIADDALDYYYFDLADSLAQNNQKIYKIFFTVQDESDPGFYGDLFISDSIFNLIKLDVHLNDAANPGGFFTKINIFQQFLPFNLPSHASADEKIGVIPRSLLRNKSPELALELIPLIPNIYMPIDYRLFVEGNFMGLAKFGFEINSIMYEYGINQSIRDDFFDMAVLSVERDADQKDSLHWVSTQTIPNTLEEISAYSRIDSIESVPKTFWDKFSFFSTSIALNDNFGISGPLGLYHFSRVEGSALDFSAFFRNLNNKRLSGDVSISNGFADNKFKWSTTAGYYFGDYRTTHLEVSAYNKLNQLFAESDGYNPITSTFTNLLGKYDFRDYFYSKGFSAKLESEVIPILKLGAGFSTRTDRSGIVNTNFSLLNKSKTYNYNQPIYDARINLFSFSFALDFRKYIEDGYFRRRTSLGKSYALLKGEAFVSNEAFGSQEKFIIYRTDLTGELQSFNSTRLDFDLRAIFTDNALPYQYLTAFPGNINTAGKNFTFRTLNIADAIGDRSVMLMTQYRFKDELFKMLNIPIIEDLQLNLEMHFNAGWNNFSNKSKIKNRALLISNPTDFKNPLLELGFGLGHIMLPLKFEFTWRLNHLNKNNFVFGINTFAL